VVLLLVILSAVLSPTLGVVRVIFVYSTFGVFSTAVFSAAVAVLSMLVFVT